MRVTRFLPAAVFVAAAVTGQSVAAGQMSIEQKLHWARETIDVHAVTRQFEPPAKSSSTRWQVGKIDGCTMELKETKHREAPEAVETAEGIYGISEDKVVTWTFDLGSLAPQYVLSDTIGSPQIKIFAPSDVFHTKTEVVTRKTNSDGTVASTQNWSTSGSERNLWIFFDSADGDNGVLVKKLEVDLRNAVSACALRSGQTGAYHKW